MSGRNDQKKAAIHGQVDSIVSIFATMSSYFKKNSFTSSSSLLIL